MNSVCKSLCDMLGSDYIRQVCLASASLGLGDYADLLRLGEEEVEFFPAELAERLDTMLPSAGQSILPDFASSDPGAGTQAFDQAFKRSAAPLSGIGFFRLGEDGRLYIISKSEHYQASLGHNFPGWRLLANASRIGITNITHNNTRGHITRVLERELIRLANGLAKDDKDGLLAVKQSLEPHVLNRVINLETGSLAVEAGLKMMLARFYRLQSNFPEPKYSGRCPVFLVMGDKRAGKEANYHGTTVLAQCLRGMWPDFSAVLEAAGLLKVVAVPINDADGFQRIVAEHDCGNSKVAGFFHELVLMNYGGMRLTQQYIERVYAICQQRDIPILADEIQSCIWSPELFLFREYACRPDFVAIGKGFPGGQYPASKILTTAPLDNLNQFGALVTNGQEELASLANLITVEFADANRQHIAHIGDLWESALQQLAQRYPQILCRADGKGHLGALFFSSPEQTVTFCDALGRRFGIDISAQTYKADCPPAALSKLPLISSSKLVDFIIACMETILSEEFP